MNSGRLPTVTMITSLELMTSLLLVLTSPVRGEWCANSSVGTGRVCLPTRWEPQCADSTLYLNCRSESPVVWYRESLQDSTTEGAGVVADVTEKVPPKRRERIVQNERIVTRRSDDRHQLVISNVQTSDSGMYTCSIDGAEMSISAPIYDCPKGGRGVAIIKPAEAETTRYALPGDDVTLTCVVLVSGPRDFVQWYRLPYRNASRSLVERVRGLPGHKTTVYRHRLNKIRELKLEITNVTEDSFGKAYVCAAKKQSRKVVLGRGSTEKPVYSLPEKEFYYPPITAPPLVAILLLLLFVLRVDLKYHLSCRQVSRDEKDRRIVCINSDRPRDVQFILNNLAPRLEEEWGYELLLHFRDFTVSNDDDEFSRRLESAATVMLVITQDLVYDRRCMRAFELAQEIGRRLIFLVVDHDTRGWNEVNQTLKDGIRTGGKFFSSNTRLEWIPPTGGGHFLPKVLKRQRDSDLFWKKLYLSLPRIRVTESRHSEFVNKTFRVDESGSVRTENSPESYSRIVTNHI